MEGRPWSPAEAEMKLAHIVDVLDSQISEVRDLAIEAAEREHDFKMAEAKEYASMRLMGVSAADASKRVITKVEAEHLAHVTSEALARSKYKQIDLLKSQCDALRSLLVSARGDGR